MSTKELLEEALRLKPDEKSLIVEGLLRSLDEPDAKLDSIWIDEAEKRLAAYRAGQLKTVPADEIFKRQ